MFAGKYERRIRNINNNTLAFKIIKINTELLRERSREGKKEHTRKRFIRQEYITNKRYTSPF